MILGPVSIVDCLVFCTFLVPQLLIHVGFIDTIVCALRCLPFVLYRLPRGFIHDQFIAGPQAQSPFVAQASMFEDFVIRCVRYAFANVPPRIGRVFFSRKVALPFLRFRMLRHGYLRSPVHWREYREKNFKGVWIVSDPTKRPDVVVYYLHGGGFSMGSAWFYLEFLLSWHSLLEEAGYKNPAIFGLDYTLVPDACFPTQVEEVIHGYSHVLTLAEDPSNVVLSGDSAGATLALSLMLHIGRKDARKPNKGGEVSARPARLERPAMVVLISPWATLVTPYQHNTESDYLDVPTLQRFARDYSGPDHSVDDPLVSPGDCEDPRWWRRAAPSKGGVFITYGEEEVFASDAKKLVKTLQDARVKVSSLGEEAGIHAWPVASLFLSTSRERRLKGLQSIVGAMREQML